MGQCRGYTVFGMPGGVGVAAYGIAPVFVGDAAGVLAISGGMLFGLSLDIGTKTMVSGGGTLQAYADAINAIAAGVLSDPYALEIEVKNNIVTVLFSGGMAIDFSIAGGGEVAMIGGAHEDVATLHDGKQFFKRRFIYDRERHRTVPLIGEDTVTIFPSGVRQVVDLDAGSVRFQGEGLALSGGKVYRVAGEEVTQIDEGASSVGVMSFVVSTPSCGTIYATEQNRVACAMPPEQAAWIEGVCRAVTPGWAGIGPLGVFVYDGSLKRFVQEWKPVTVPSGVKKIDYYTKGGELVVLDGVSTYPIQNDAQFYEFAYRRIGGVDFSKTIVVADGYGHVCDGHLFGLSFGFADGYFSANGWDDGWASPPTPDR